MDHHHLDLTLGSPAETDQFARRLGEILAPGDVLLLQGDVGAGKTHFARALIRSILRCPEDIPSPTFTLVQTYDTSLGEVWHADLYRLTSPDEIEELGLIDAFDHAISLIEWPDRLGELAPLGALWIDLSAPLGDDRRTAHLHWTAPQWGGRLTWLK